MKLSNLYAGEPAIQAQGVLPLNYAGLTASDGIRTRISRSQGEVTQIFTTGNVFR